MKNGDFLKTVWIILFGLLPALMLSGQAENQKKVLIIGIDGVRPDALLSADTKHLDALWQNGAYSFKARTDEISSSGPCWTAMLTGVWHDKHKVVSNSYKNPNLETYPHFFRRIRAARPELKTYSVVNWGPLHNILQEHDATYASSPISDRRVTAKVARILRSEDVDVMFVQLDHVDHAGHTHDYSPDSEKYLRAIEKSDRQVGRMVNALKKRRDYAREDWLVIISTDHGGSDYGHGKNIPEHTTIFYIASGKSAGRGEIAGPVNVVDVSATALEHLGISLRDEWNLDGRVAGLASGDEADLLEYVDPFIGTGFHGHTFPGPVMPYGMVQPGPDTRLNGWDACSGYHYSDRKIHGFSHTHLSGTGIGDLGDILMLPFTGDSQAKPVATFDKAGEESRVGYYAVKFNNYDVRAELTATKRAGIHRYSYGAAEKKRLLLDIGHILQRTWGHENVQNELEIIDRHHISGMKHSTGWAQDHRVYFYAEFSSPFTVDEVFTNGNPIEPGRKFKADSVYAYLSFKKLEDKKPLLVKVGISPVDREGARNNMRLEMPGWDFEKVQQANRDVWREALSKIRVYTEDEGVMTQFYTALYHTKIAPMLYQDADGRYRGMDGKIHQASPGKTNYTVFSMWDTFRALHPLMTIIDEKRSADWVNNLLLKYEQGGFLPMWPLASNYTGTMVGYPAVANIADAIAKGLPGIDPQLALEAAIKSASYEPFPDSSTVYPRKKRLMPVYNKYVNEGRHIPADEIEKSVSFGLEMAYYDWCIAQIAASAGEDSVAAYFQERSKNYTHYFDQGTGFMRGKNRDGSWDSPFNPRYSSHETSPYVEGNAWQWTWFVPHDVEGLINLYGGREPFTRKLDTLFSTSSLIEGEDASGDITGLIGQYAHGNEPSHHIAYLYTHAGEAWKTQDLVDRIFWDFYAATPDGIVGNEDCGQMSAWYILNAIGFYQVSPGNPLYTIGRPLFDRVEIDVGDGRTFSLVTRNNGRENRFVQEVQLNGQKQQNLFIHHQDIMDGKTLEILMDKKPNLELSTGHIRQRPW